MNKSPNRVYMTLLQLAAIALLPLALSACTGAATTSSTQPMAAAQQNSTSTQNLAAANQTNQSNKWKLGISEF